MHDAADGEVRAYELVLRYIEAGILDGRYRNGELLPPERDLAALLNVGRPAVREAMRVLSTQGLIAASAGRGGGTRLVSAQDDALARIFRLHLAVAGQGITDLTETRIALERASVWAAAKNVDSEMVAELDKILRAMHHDDQIESFNSLDTDFHVLIARAGSNSLVADLTVAIREAVKDPIREASIQMEDWQSFRLSLIDEHQAIRDAVAAGDCAEAVAQTERHIRRAYHSLIGVSGV
ncbi:MAG: FCD domain-containing protein [Propionibacteriaceae bacterium]|jgi:DNA-binding FadR family transcriptional regulator|nr:FCD domain-containing protein [Propionibacteriaceae bacterium]